MRNVTLGIVSFILVILLLDHSSLSKTIDNQYLEIESLQEEKYELEETIQECSDSIGEANNIIEEANYMIDDARVYAWDNYKNMGDALESLEDIEVVDNPCY